MGVIMDHIHKLAVEIGPRGSATREEANAAAYVSEEFAEYGLEAWQQSFLSITTFSWSYLIYFLGPLLGLALAKPVPWLGVVVTALGAGAFLLELNSWPVVSRLLPKSKSVNAIGRRMTGNAGSPTAKVVLMAHLDSSKAALSFKPGMVENFRLSFILMVVLLLASPVLLLAHSLTGWALWWYLALGAALYLVVNAGFLIHRELWNRYTHGANDNASGVGVMLALAEDAGKGAYPNLDLWFVATGSEEAGTFGATAFLEEYGDKLKDAYFINLDNVGAGEVHYMAGEGMFPTHKASSELLDLANTVQKSSPDLNVRQGVYTLMSTDALPAMVRGYKAMSLLATRNGLLPNWHWITDVYENVEEETVTTCYLFVRRMLELVS